MKTTFAKLKAPVRVRFWNGFEQSYDQITRRKGTRIMDTHATNDAPGITGCIEARTEVEIIEATA